jgi:hypothetical protein
LLLSIGRARFFVASVRFCSLLFVSESKLKSAILIQKVAPQGQDALYGKPRRPALLSVQNREYGAACIPNHKTRF